MSTLIEIATNIIAPIFIVVGISVLVDRQFDIDPRALSRLVIYLFTPFLIFEGIANSDLSAGEAGQLITLAIVPSVLVAVAAWQVARLAGFDRRLQSAFVLASTLINAGNYGVPLNRFAFGAEGEERALLFFVATAIVSYTLGIYLASLGKASARRALLNVFTVPLPYAAALAVAVNVGQIDLPLALDRSVSLLSAAAIPSMLVILGVQLSRASIRGQIRVVLMASGMRLVVAPLIGFGLAVLIGAGGLTRQVAIVQMGMPTAVISGVLATEFGADSEVVTATILVDTLLSMFTLSVVLSLVM